MLVARSVGTSFISRYSTGHAWSYCMAGVSQTRLRGVLFPTRNGQGFEESRSGLENCLGLSMT